jgi:hypothetical protein
MLQLLRGRYIPPMAPLAAQLPRPSHLTSSSMSKLVIDLTEDVTEDEVVIKQEPQELEKRGSKQEQLRLRVGGRITTGGPGESSVALRQ